MAFIRRRPFWDRNFFDVTLYNEYARRRPHRRSGKSINYGEISNQIKDYMSKNTYKLLRLQQRILPGA